MPIRRLIVPAVLASAALAGCGQNAPADQTAATSAVTASATSPAPTSEDAADSTASSADTNGQSSSPTSSESASRTTASQQAELPQTDPGDYGDAAIEAAKSGDAQKVAKYVAPSALTGLNPAALPKTDLTRTACEDDMCSWSTEDGKRVTMTFDMDKVQAGKPQAITRIKVS